MNSSLTTSLTKLFLIPTLASVVFYIFWSIWACSLPSYQIRLTILREYAQNISLLSWVYSALLSPLSPSTAPKVILRQGTLIGTVLRDDFPRSVEAFLGIPYAQPPTGERRFRHPTPVIQSNKTFDASAYKKNCPGSFRFLKESSWDEDCLYLNIFRPRQRDKYQRLPVAVYFHGGAFNFGAGKLHLHIRIVMDRVKIC